MVFPKVKFDCNQVYSQTLLSVVVVVTSDPEAYSDLFGFSFAEQQVADDEETEEGKRGITYEVRTPDNLNFNLFLYMVKEFCEYFSFVTDISEQGSHGQEEEGASKSSRKTQKKVLQGSDKA